MYRRPYRASGLCFSPLVTRARIRQGVGREASLVLAERSALTVETNFKLGSYDRVLRARRCGCPVTRPAKPPVLVTRPPYM